jgi:hypothetical protein
MVSWQQRKFPTNKYSKSPGPAHGERFRQNQRPALGSTPRITGSMTITEYFKIDKRLDFRQEKLGLPDL